MSKPTEPSFLRRVATLFALVIVMPALSAATVQSLTDSGHGDWIGFIAALACLGLSFVFVQLSMITVGLARVLKWLLKIERDLEKPPSRLETAIYLSPPVVGAAFIYGTCGLLVALFDSENPVLSALGITVFGLAFGGSISWAYAHELLDADDLGPVGPEPMGNSSPARKNDRLL